MSKSDITFPLSSGAQARNWRPSLYNFHVVRERIGDVEIVLFNAATGSTLRLEGANAADLARLLADPDAAISEDALPTAVLDDLVRSGLLVTPEMDEVAAVRDRYRTARERTPAVLTVTTTMDCNLGCYYCYEERSGASLDAGALPELLALVERTLNAPDCASLHVDWYGGEPLLNVDFIEAASYAIQEACRTRGVHYHASIISNGTLWPDDPAAFVRRHQVRQVQISFDGMRANHDKRRHTRKGFSGPDTASSFDRAVALIDELVDETRVDLRFNIDRRNSGDMLQFIRFAAARGWLTAKHPAVFQPARLSAYSEASAFMRTTQLTLREFDEFRATARAELAGVGRIEESEIPDGFPRPKDSVCAALARGSTVVGADGSLYRCGLQVGERGRAVGQLKTVISDARESDAAWWDAFDPTTLSSCRRCSFLPLCWGGCPKKHLERDQDAIAEQGRYWRTNLPRLIAERARLSSGYTPTSFREDDQFRSGDTEAASASPSA